MIWNVTSDEPDIGVVRYRLNDGTGAMSYADVVHCLQQNPEFRHWFSRGLAATELPAYFWETPPVTTSNLDRDFEYVLIGSRALAGRHPDPAPFSEQFRAGEPIATFSNLGGDALLVAPSPISGSNGYAHLAAFLDSAPDEQIHALWKSVSQCLLDTLSQSPLWLNTSGLGVAWVHVRLDSVPKYYQYAPYRIPPGL